VGEIGITDALNDIPRSPRSQLLSEDLSASTESCNTLSPESIPEMHARSNNPRTISGLQLLQNTSPIHVIVHSPKSLSLQKPLRSASVSHLIEIFSPQMNSFGIKSLHQKSNTVVEPDRRCNFLILLKNHLWGLTPVNARPRITSTASLENRFLPLFNLASPRSLPER